MSFRTCQRKGCTTSLPPRFQVIVNLKDQAGKDLGELAADAIVCESCRGEMKMLHVFTAADWMNLTMKLFDRGSPPPHKEKSELSFREIKIPS